MEISSKYDSIRRKQMKLEKILKIMIHIVLISVIICIWLPSEVHADWGITGLRGDRSGTTEISVFGNKVVQIISTIGSILSVIVIIVLGIKYMMGSVEEKATYKKTLLPFIIGAAFIFAASTIANIIYNVAINL